MKTIEKIRAEIERRIKELDEQIVDIYDSKAVLRKDELQRLLSFIDALEEPVIEDLEEAADTYAYTIYPSEGVANIEVNNAFKAGAKWMVEQGEILLGIITKVGDKLDVETMEYIIPEESEFERNEYVTVQIRKIEPKEDK